RCLCVWRNSDKLLSYVLACERFRMGQIVKTNIIAYPVNICMNGSLAIALNLHMLAY
ncbi:MAG: hypothetical protein ACI9FB_004262, partial [Candidatus Azotimanducaceae bacterium]